MARTCIVFCIVTGADEPVGAIDRLESHVNSVGEGDTSLFPKLTCDLRWHEMTRREWGQLEFDDEGSQHDEHASVTDDDAVPGPLDKVGEGRSA